MKMLEALAIVFDLAEQNALEQYIREGADEDLRAEAERQQKALSVVRRSLKRRRQNKNNG